MRHGRKSDVRTSLKNNILYCPIPSPVPDTPTLGAIIIARGQQSSGKSQEHFRDSGMNMIEPLIQWALWASYYLRIIKSYLSKLGNYSLGPDLVHFLFEYIKLH